MYWRCEKLLFPLVVLFLNGLLLDQTSEKILPILERVKGQLTSLKLCQVPISWQYMMEVLASSPQLQVLQMDCIDFPIQEHVSICLPFFLEQAELVFHRAVRSLQMTCSESLQSLDVTASVNSFGLVHGESLKKLRLVSRTEAIVQFWSHRPSFPNLQSLELRHSNNNYREFHTSSLFFTDLPMLQELTCDLEWYHFAVCNLPKLHTCRFSKNLWRATVVFENLPLLTLIQLREVREVRIENLPLLQTLQVFFSPDDECFLKAIGTPCLSCLRVRNFDSFGSNVDPFPQLQELTVDIGDVSHFVNLTRYSPLLKDVELFQSRPRKNWYSWYSNTEELVQYLSTFPVLSKLTLNYLGETQLKMVTGFPMLEEVVIEGSLSTIQLEQMDRLRFLFVGPADTVMLCNLPLLSKCSIHSRFHIAVENAPQLESLEAKFAETFYATQISICQVPSLRCLVLKNFLFGNPLCDASIALEKPLWRAELEVSRSSPQLLPCVTGTSQLSLRVLDPALMHELSQLPNLLHLEICGLQDDSLVVDGFPSLTFLHFFRDCILDDLKVQCLPKLEQLWLFKHEDLSSIKNVSLDSLANLSKVVVLKHHHALNIYASNLPQFTELQTCSATKLIVSSRDTIPRFQMNNRVKLLLKE